MEIRTEHHGRVEVRDRLLPVDGDAGTAEMRAEDGAHDGSVRAGAASGIDDAEQSGLEARRVVQEHVKHEGHSIPDEARDPFWIFPGDIESLPETIPEGIWLGLMVDLLHFAEALFRVVNVGLDRGVGESHDVAEELHDSERTDRGHDVEVRAEPLFHHDVDELAPAGELAFVQTEVKTERPDPLDHAIAARQGRILGLDESGEFISEITILASESGNTPEAAAVRTFMHEWFLAKDQELLTEGFTKVILALRDDAPGERGWQVEGFGELAAVREIRAQGEQLELFEAGDPGTFRELANLRLRELVGKAAEDVADEAADESSLETVKRLIGHEYPPLAMGVFCLCQFTLSESAKLQLKDQAKK